jgi:molecular chaperone GrpE (heat shock protein)
MAVNVGNLIVEMSANVANLQRDFGKAYGAANSAAAKFKKIFSGIGLSLVAGLSIGGITRQITGILDTADMISKLSQSVGVSTELLSGYSHALKLSGTNVESFGRSVGLLSKNMLAALQGGKAQADVFKALGIEVKDADGNLRDTNDVLGEVADRFAGMQDGAEKTALAMKLFGRSGAELIPFLNNGSKGLANMRAEAQKMGLVFSTETGKRIEEVNDSFTRMAGQIKGAAYQLTFSLLPALESTSTALSALLSGEGLGQGGFGGVELLDEQIVTATAEVQKFKESLAGGKMYGAKDSVMAVYAENLRMAENNLKRLLAVQAKAAEKKETPVVGGVVAELERQETAQKKNNQALKEATAAYDDVVKRLGDYASAMRQADIDQTTEDVAVLVENMGGISLMLSTQGDVMSQLTEGLTLYEIGFENVNDVSDTAAERLKKMKETAAEFGFTFSSALEDAIIQGGKFSDILKGLADDITRMMVRETVTKPLGNFISGAIGGLFGGGSGGGGSVGMATGGIISEHIVGVGLSTGTNYEFGERGPETVTPGIGSGGSGDSSGGGNTNQIYIYAADSKSFDDMCRRNPNSIIGPIEEGLRLGNRGLKNSLRNGG